MLGLEAPIRARSLATCSEPAREEQARSALGESKEVTRPGSAQLDVSFVAAHRRPIIELTAILLRV